MEGYILQHLYSTLRFGSFTTLRSSFTRTLNALSGMYKSRLNQMGESGLQNNNAVDLVILICMAQMHQSKRNKTC